MGLPQGLIDYLNQAAQAEGIEQPKHSDDLFSAGVLDSFTLVDFITVIEGQCGINVPDADVNPGNFQSIEKIENYLASHKGQL